MRERPLILIVDDEPFNVDYLEQELEDLEYDTVAAYDGQEALEQVAATLPDMILLDIMMPVMDGFVVLERLKAEEAWRDIPVVVISAMSDINSVAKGIEAGAEDYLPKPFDPTLLQARLLAGLEKKRLRDQEVEYLRQVARLTEAAQAIEENRFQEASLEPVVAREDALGDLGRVFQRMAREVHAREQRLQQQIAQLQMDMTERREAAGETAVIYLPMDRRQALAAGRELPPVAHGVALFADISGFTPLTGALAAELGHQRGAEEIVRHLNRVFAALVAEIHAYRGSVIVFSGDALTAWFDEAQTQETGTGAARRAVASALALQAAIAPLAEQVTAGGVTVKLSLKVAVSGGELHRFLPGDPQYHVLEALAGRVLEAVTAGEELAESGEVLLSAVLAAELADQVQPGDPRGDDGAFVVLRGLKTAVAPCPWPPLPADALTAEQARPWLIDPVFEQVRAGQSDFLSQLRPATSLFMHFAGVDYDGDPEAGAQLDAFIRWVQNTLREHGGQMLDLVIGDKGSYLYCVFGVPLALERDAVHAVAAALALQQMPQPLSYIRDVRLGLTRGLLRAGAYGSSARRTYSALGDATNMASRLMMLATDGILADEGVFAEARGEYEFETLDAVQVKGRPEPMPVFRPLGLRSRATVRRRLDELPPLLQTAVKTASVLPSPFEVQALAAIYPDPEAAQSLPELLAQMVSLGLLQEPADGRFQFSDPALRETAYDTMLFAQRRRLHRAAAEWLEATYAADLSPYYRQLAEQWQRAEDTDRTIRYLELAAVQAREQGDLEEALAFFNRTLELQRD